jgi:hypothetical protein
MEKLILVRYGQYENEHLSDDGRETMVMASRKIGPLIYSKKFIVVSADIPRAVESAQILAEQLHGPQVQSFSEFYAAEEDGYLPDIQKAVKLMIALGQDCDILIAVVSREYIEAIPNHVLPHLAGEKNTLNRGEIFVLDYQTENLTKL